jgi:iron complex outermembrane receptor protein
MTTKPNPFRLVLIVLVVALVWYVPQPVMALPQADDETEDEERGEENEDEIVSEVIFVTGSRIATNPLAQRAPVVELDTRDLERSGLTNIGATLQQLPSVGSAINTRFNVPGNSGFPQDGNGIGAGAVQLSLRNLGAKRTLVLVDGKRWIAGASASGVPVAVDLNTLPANMIERIEVLQDGASAVYGSDAIAGVVNIITKQDFRGMQIAAQSGQYVSDGDGTASEISGLWGGGDDNTHIVFSASYYDEGDIETFDRAQSAFPTPFGTSCLDGGCSSFTPQGRFVLGPNFDFARAAATFPSSRRPTASTSTVPASTSC